MLKAVLWDMDGVLIDTGALHYETWAAALTPRGFTLTPELFQATFGMNNRGVLTTLFGYEPEAALMAQITDEKEVAFRRLVRGTARPLPGVLTWLARLQTAGVRQAVASSGPPENIAAVVDELGIGPYFDTLVSGARMAGKPDPAVFLEAARQLGAAPENCVVVEDAVAGVAAARAAGMRCIAVTTTNLASALTGAALIVDSLADLPEDAFWRVLGEAPNQKG